MVINQSSLSPPPYSNSVASSAAHYGAMFCKPHTSEASSVISSVPGVASSATEAAGSIISSAQSVAATLADSATREASPIFSTAISFANTAGGSGRILLRV